MLGTGVNIAPAWETHFNIEDIVWQNAVGVSVSGNSITKTAADGWNNAGASSVQSLASGAGYVEFSSSAAASSMAGLSNGDSDQGVADIDFAVFFHTDGIAYVYESGAWKASLAAYVPGDVFRVSVEGGVVKYRKNGALLYTSLVAPTYPLLVDTSIYNNGGQILNAVIGFPA